MTVTVTVTVTEEEGGVFLKLEYLNKLIVTEWPWSRTQTLYFMHTQNMPMYVCAYIHTYTYMKVDILINMSSRRIGNKNEPDTRQKSPKWTKFYVYTHVCTYVHAYPLTSRFDHYRGQEFERQWTSNKTQKNVKFFLRFFSSKLPTTAFSK